MFNIRMANKYIVFIFVSREHFSFQPNTSVIDCIVDGSKFIIQASYNPDHYNSVLNNVSSALQIFIGIYLIAESLCYK